MSKLDFLTISIFVVCIAAIIFLIFKTTQLINGSETPGLDRSLIEDTSATPYGDSYDPASEGGAAEFDPYDPAGEAADDAVDVYDPVGEDSGFDRPKAAPTRSSGSSAATSRGQYIVVAGSFRQEANAQTQVNRLKSLGYANAEVGFTNNGAFAVAVVNRFDNIAQARALVQELGTQYKIEAMVKE